MFYIPFIAAATGIVTKEAKEYLEITSGKHSHFAKTAVLITSPVITKVHLPET
jgi:hypothetical protein